MRPHSQVRNRGSPAAESSGAVELDTAEDVSLPVVAPLLSVERVTSVVGRVGDT